MNEDIPRRIRGSQASGLIYDDVDTTPRSMDQLATERIGKKRQPSIFDDFLEPDKVVPASQIDPGTEVPPLAPGDAYLDAPRHLYVNITPGGIKFRYAGSVRTVNQFKFYGIYFGLYGPDTKPATLDVMKRDFKTLAPTHSVHALPEYLGEHIRRHRGKWVTLKD